MTNVDLKTKREFDEIEFSFRYNKVNEKQRIYIENELSDLKLRTNKIENEIYVISFPLTKDLEPNRINSINKKLEFPSSKFGLFVSFTTSHDLTGFTLPKEIGDFYQIVGGEFDCSIIMIGEDE
mgnify:CR=1 FL=1